MISATRFDGAGYAVLKDGEPVAWTTTPDEADTDLEQRQRLHPDATLSIEPVEVVDADYSHRESPEEHDEDED